MLNNYASQIAGNKTKNLAVAQLYRKAANYLQAAKVIYEVKKLKILYLSNLQQFNYYNILLSKMIVESKIF